MDAFTKTCAWLIPQHCQLCHQSVQPKQQVCDYCCEAFSGLMDNNAANLFLRADIQRQFSLPEVDFLLALDWYRPPLSVWLKRFKYQQQLYSQQAISQLLCMQLARLAHSQDWCWPDVITPVPLASSRLIWRGFNQVVQLWQDALPPSLIQMNMLSRKASLRAQAKLNAQQRRRSLTNAFSVNVDVRHQHVAIVDDVLTTGSTINSIAKTLKQAGARSVAAWVICLTPKELV